MSKFHLYNHHISSLLTLHKAMLVPDEIREATPTTRNLNLVLQTTSALGKNSAAFKLGHWPKTIAVQYRNAIEVVRTWGA